MATFVQWVTTSENGLATAAARRVADAVAARSRRCDVNPLVLHGASGTGKTHLVGALVDEATRRCPDLIVCLLPAGDCRPPDDWRRLARDADLFVLEDVQHLPASAAEGLLQVLDARLARQRQTVVTATLGPGQLTDLPARLAGRLAAGLVVGMEPLSQASRLLLLGDRARRRGLRVDDDVLAWLAEHLDGSGRRLDGALTRLEALARMLGRPPRLTEVVEPFRDDADSSRPDVERILEGVSRYYAVEPRQIRAPGRGRAVVVPRQVGMYLARSLTPLSLEQIGASFGGRDHTTVLHACRKVEEAQAHDATLALALRQLRAELARGGPVDKASTPRALPVEFG